MTDHYAKALAILQYVSTTEMTSTEALVSVTATQVHAVLALAEQQRIANLIALAGSQHPLLREQVAADAANALTHWNDHENSDLGGWHELRPDLARALRIETQ